MYFPRTDSTKLWNRTDHVGHSTVVRLLLRLLLYGLSSIMLVCYVCVCVQSGLKVFPQDHGGVRLLPWLRLRMQSKYMYTWAVAASMRPVLGQYMYIQQYVGVVEVHHQVEMMSLQLRPGLTLSRWPQHSVVNEPTYTIWCPPKLFKKCSAFRHFWSIIMRKVVEVPRSLVQQ